MDIMFFIQKKGEAKPTHIMYKANLSYNSLQEYLDLLVSKGFIEEIKDGKRISYKITDKGLEHINEFRRIEKFKDAFGLE
jgi:predicted transcriptional regulator